MRRALLASLRYYRSFGISFRRVLTDNGACYKSRRFARLCQRLGLRHLRTKPYSPQTNGKAERFIQTALREWAYARACQSHPAIALGICRSGCINTTGTDLMPAFNISPPSPASPC